MDYQHFKNKLNAQIFGDDLNYEILLTVLQNPERYTGLFRITNAKTKLIQNITQSCEIKFGDFIEDILTEYIIEMGYHVLDNNIGSDEYTLSADQVFKDRSQIYLIEQKIRDDHDSTKKRGQYANFIKKIKRIKQNFHNPLITAVMWFSDDSLNKNRKYYLEEVEKNIDDSVKIFILYGRELFEQIFHRIDIWDEFVAHLKRNKEERSKEILNVPDLDTSPDMRKALLKVRQEKPGLIKNLLSNKPKFTELRRELFPTGKNLEVLQDAERRYFTR